MDNSADTSRFGLSQEFVRQALETLNEFESKIDDIRRQPDTLSVVSESEEFKFDLHYVVGLLLLGEDELRVERRSLENHELFRKRFFCVVGEDEIRTLSEKIRFYESHMDRMRKVLNQAREMGLGPCIDTAKQARTLDSRIKWSLVHFDLRSAVLFESVVRAINDLRERNSLCPAWADHEAKFTLHQNIIGQTRGARYILSSLVYLFSYFLPQHAAQVTTNLNFHCRYFDDEIRNLAVCVRAQCVHQYDLLEANLISESNFCDIWLHNIDNFTPCDLLPRRFGLRMYRVCLITGSCRLADKWMNLRFDENLDEKDVVDALHGTITSIRKMKQLSITRINLNGDHEGVGARCQTQYKLPERKEELEEPTCEKPWWVEVFGNRIKGIFPPVSIAASTGESCSTTADTVVLSTEKYDSMIRKDRSSDFQKKLAEKSNTSVSSSDNQHAAWIFTHNDRMQDRDMYSMNFSLPDGVVQDAITLELTNRQGEKQSRKTNIKRNTPYHCRVLSYDVLQDEWVITSDFCRVTGPLTVEKKGASCDPLLGNCGLYEEEEDSFVFKVLRDPHDHRLRNYLSEIRSQCTASFYVDKFSRLIGHRFERLRMLTVDCLLLFADSDRETIIDIMTREKHVDIMEERKSALKFDKFTNNTSWKNRGIDTSLLEAFAHYTYQESDGVLMVADLQGWVWNTHEHVVIYTLTDPVIHCPKRPLRFGETNREENGIFLFFTKIHPECNEICMELRLKRPSEFENA